MIFELGLFHKPDDVLSLPSFEGDSKVSNDLSFLLSIARRSVPDDDFTLLGLWQCGNGSSLASRFQTGDESRTQNSSSLSSEQYWLLCIEEDLSKSKSSGVSWDNRENEQCLCILEREKYANSLFFVYGLFGDGRVAIETKDVRIM